MTVMVELDRVVKMIERVEDRQALKEIYNWLMQERLLKLLPHELYMKLLGALGEEEMTPEDEEAIKRSMDEGREGAMTQEKLRRLLGL